MTVIKGTVLRRSQFSECTYEVMSALGQKQISLPGRPVWEDYWKTKMEEEIDISGTDDDGHTIHGSYRVAAGVVHVTLSDGTSSTTQLGNTPAPALAKIISAGTSAQKSGRILEVCPAG